jgi:hypothetical protein
VPTFYEDFDDESAEVLAILDAEIQAIKAAINVRWPNYDLNTVVPIKERIIKQYGDQVKDKSTLKTVLPALSLQGLSHQPRLRDNPYSCEGCARRRPPEHRGEDILGGCSLRTLHPEGTFTLPHRQDLAEMLDVPTLGIDRMIEWHQKFMGKQFIENGKLNRALINETGAPSKYGLNTIEKVLSEATLTLLKPTL